MRLSTITFANGTTVDLGPLTVLIGPNNVGKSRALRDIASLVRGQVGVVITSHTFAPVSTFGDVLQELGADPDSSGKISYLSRQGDAMLLDVESLREFFKVYGGIRVLSDTPVVSECTQLLSVADRLYVTTPSSGMDLTRPEAGSLLQQLLVRERDVQPKLRELLIRMFGLESLIDNSSMVTIVLRVAKTIPATDGLTAFERAQLLKTVPTAADQGDGIRSFIGVVLPMVLHTRKVLLLDEPDAFLHPEQARALGAWIGKHCGDGENQVILATHNEDLLHGLLQSPAPVRVLRLDRPADDSTTVKVLTPDVLDDMVRSPLLSGQTVLHALFQRGVVVVEAPNDRAVYESVAATFPPAGIVFVHAQNKQTLKDIASLMRRAGVPVAAIADIDILHNDKDFEDLLTVFAPDLSALLAERRATFSPPEGDTCAESRAVLEEIRTWVLEPDRDEDVCKHSVNWLRNRLAEKAGGRSYWDQLKHRGIESLPSDAVERASAFLAQVAEQGLFVVPAGELESWFGAPKGKAGISAILSRIQKGDIPTELREFVNSILEFIRRRYKSAMPAGLESA